MTFSIQPLPMEKAPVVRLKQTNRPCHISGRIESETGQFYKTVKSMSGFFIRSRIQKQGAHTQACKSCPEPETIERQWLQPGIDPNQPGLEPIM